MAKTTITYWNPLCSENERKWQAIDGLEGIAEELTLSIDEETGEYIRLTRFDSGADTTPFGGKSQEYPEEIFIVSGPYGENIRTNRMILLSGNITDNLFAQ